MTYKPNEDRKDYVIEVSALVEFEQLQPEDLDADGECKVDGKYAISLFDCAAAQVDTETEAMKVFLGMKYLANPADFHLAFRPRRKSDTPESFRDHIGNFTFATAANKLAALTAAKQAEGRFELVVEVAALVEFDEMDEDDLSSDGTCAVDGSYLVRVNSPSTAYDDAVELALDEFHGRVAIASLDDFNITVRTRFQLDQDGDFRSILDAKDVPSVMMKALPATSIVAPKRADNTVSLTLEMVLDEVSTSVAEVSDNLKYIMESFVRNGVLSPDDSVDQWRVYESTERDSFIQRTAELMTWNESCVDTAITKEGLTDPAQIEDAVLAEQQSLDDLIAKDAQLEALIEEARKLTGQEELPLQEAIEQALSEAGVITGSGLSI
jgi:hypothetical protein